MALQLASNAFSDDFGNTYPAAYAMVTRFNDFDFVAKSGEVVISLWKDAASQAAGKAPLATRKVALTVAQFNAITSPASSGPVTQIIYNYLKANVALFSGATDVA